MLRAWRTLERGLRSSGCGFSNLAEKVLKDPKNWVVAQKEVVVDRLNLSEDEKSKLNNVLKSRGGGGFNPGKNLDLMNKWGLTLEQQKKVVLSSCSTFTVSPGTLERKWEWLSENVGFSTEELVRLVSKLPTIFTRSLDSKVQPILEILKGLGFDLSEIRSILTSAPQIFSLSVENNIKPKVQLLKELEFTKEELKDFIKQRPWVLEKQIAAKVGWLRENLNIDGRYLQAQILKHPKFLNSNFMEMDESFKYLLKEGLDRWQAFDMLCMQPSKNVLSSGRLIDKVEFAKKVLKKDIKAILDWPEYITRPLHGHIGLRTCFMAREGFQFWNERLSALFVFGDQKFLKLFDEMHPSGSSLRFYEFKERWSTLDRQQKDGHLDLLSKPNSRPWRE